MSIAHANPDEADTHSHIVQIDDTDIFLFNLIRNTNGHLTPGNVQTIMQRILTKHHISVENCNLNILKFLESKLGRLWKSWKSSKGTSGRKQLLKNGKNPCTKSTTKLVVRLNASLKKS